MATFAEIIKAVDFITASYKPQTIILFGSYAYGTPNYDSDVDLLVLKDFRGSQNQEYNKIRWKIVMPFPVDLLVRTPALVRRRIAQNDCFLAEIMQKGLVLYDADNTRMGHESRGRLRRRLASRKIPQAEPARYDLISLPAMR